jgi:hypothetical protein
MHALVFARCVTCQKLILFPRRLWRGLNFAKGLLHTPHTAPHFVVRF